VPSTAAVTSWEAWRLARQRQRQKVCAKLRIGETAVVLTSSGLTLSLPLLGTKMQTLKGTDFALLRQLGQRSCPLGYQTFRVKAGKYGIECLRTVSNGRNLWRATTTLTRFVVADGSRLSTVTGTPCPHFDRHSVSTF